MNKLLLLTLTSTSLLFSYDKSYQNPTKASALSLDADVGYTSYIIDVGSSELNRAIDYNVIELRLGGSYSYEDWIFGVNGKLLLDEQKSNLNSTSSSNNFDDIATIDRNEFSIFANYKLSEEFRGNILYRYSKLQSNDSYVDFYNYDTTFNYQTNGVALSFVYIPSFLRKENQLLWLSSGVAYSQASVEIYEDIDSKRDDVSIDETKNSFGFQLGMGYNYSFTDNLTLKISGDWYRFDFGELNVVSSNLGGVLEQASLDEETYSVRLGLSYRFN